MKKRVSIILVLLMLFSCTSAFALDIPGYEGGIQNEMRYQEITFITGEPILLIGTLAISKNKYTYRLENVEKGAKMTRTITYKEDIKVLGDQTITNLSLSGYSEALDINGVKYELTLRNHQWSKSGIKEHKPGVDYFAGEWTGRKTYTINRNQGTVYVETMGKKVGYNHHWGKTETQSLEHFIEYDRTGINPVKWQGTAKVEAVHNITKDYVYEANAPSQISFSGGYLLTTQEENVLKYSYDLPRFGGDGDIRNQRNIGTGSFTLDTNPKNNRLIVPSIRDIVGHWAEEDIMFLASLNGMPATGSNIGPGQSMTRGEFARAIAVILDIKSKEPEPVRARATVQVKNSVFVDVSNENPNKGYIEAVFEKGIMRGVGKDQFLPNGTITRAEIAAIIVRALGFEKLAPIQNYSTGFYDDDQIPGWSRDAIYIVRELGIMQGNQGYFQPNRAMTKAEAARLLTNLINYLQQDLRYDYRERILNY